MDADCGAIPLVEMPSMTAWPRRLEYMRTFGVALSFVVAGFLTRSVPVVRTTRGVEVPQAIGSNVGVFVVCCA